MTLTGMLPIAVFADTANQKHVISLSSNNFNQVKDSEIDFSPILNGKGKEYARLYTQDGFLRASRNIDNKVIITKNGKIVTQEEQPNSRKNVFTQLKAGDSFIIQPLDNSVFFFGIRWGEFHSGYIYTYKVDGSGSISLVESKSLFPKPAIEQDFMIGGQEIGAHQPNPYHEKDLERVILAVNNCYLDIQVVNSIGVLGSHPNMLPLN